MDIWAALWIVGLVFIVILWFNAIAQAVSSGKWLWAAVTFFAPVAGTLLWYAYGRPVWKERFAMPTRDPEEMVEHYLRQKGSAPPPQSG